MASLARRTWMLHSGREGIFSARPPRAKMATIAEAAFSAPMIAPAIESIS